MKNQQQAEREEQQRIKNLVLNYDLRESGEADGDSNSIPTLPENPNIHNPLRQAKKGSRRIRSAAQRGRKTVAVRGLESYS